MLNFFRKQFLLGFTFVELMIALAINALLFSALVTFLIANLNQYHKNLNLYRLNQQLQSALFLMSSEIRRAGYWANAKNDLVIDQNNNPFMTSSTDISVNVAGNCILFTYDKSNDGLLPTISANADDERYGFRLNGQTLQARPPGASFSCTATGSAWENLSDSNLIQITNLTLTLTTNTMVTGPGTKGITQRSVDISITGQLASDSTISKTLTQHIRIMNDKFIP